MKNVFILIIILLVISCKQEPYQSKDNLADLNIIVKSEKIIDSIWVSNIGQTESFFLPYNDTIKVDFNEKLNDLYRIDIYTKDIRISSQLWLDGNNVILIGKLDNKFEIDTVLNSELYDTAINFSKNYKQLIENKSDSTTIDNFILKTIKNNTASAYSFHAARPYINRNQNNKIKIRKLFDLLENQNDTLKKHFISIHGKIENILKVSSINISNYYFKNIENQLTSIELDKPQSYLLDFWFVNCPPCVRDHKLITNKLNLLKENNIELIGISTDENYSKWKNYLTEHNYKWKNYREIDSLKRVTNDMAIWSFPTYILLDGKGEINARFNSYQDFENYIIQ